MSKSQKLKADFPGKDWDGEYIMLYDTTNSNTDHWKHKDKEYYVYRDPWKWFISNSNYYYREENLVAVKDYIYGSSPVGPYVDMDGNPNGTIEWIDFP
jgi:hypothetical protein